MTNKTITVATVMNDMQSTLTQTGMGITGVQMTHLLFSFLAAG